MKKITDSILNSVFFGDPRGFGYSHPTPREKFEEARIEALRLIAQDKSQS